MDKTEWKSPAEAPDIPRGTGRQFVVAVRRAHNGQVYTFSAEYLNAMVLIFDDDRNGDVEAADVDEEGARRVTGWHAGKDHADYDTAYYPLIDGKDELMGWQPMPAWIEPAQLPSQFNSQEKP